MSDYQYSIGSPQWFIPCLVFAAIMLVLVVINYARLGWGAWQIAAACLKSLAVCMLIGCLLEPLVRTERAKPQANMLSIVVDTSQSMTVNHSDRSQSTAAFAESILTGTQPWQESLSDAFDVRRFRFDATVERVEDFQALQFEGNASNLYSTLQSLAERSWGRPVAGCLLVADGNLTDVTTTVDWEGLGFPVYPIVPPSGDAFRDLRIDSIAVSESDFESSPITIDVRIAARGLAGQIASVRLTDSSQTVLQQQTISLELDDTTQSIRFRFSPPSSGVTFYRCECLLANEEELYAAAKSNLEATLRNNARWVSVQQRRGPYRVLYVGGRPNWEYKFLRRAIEEDAEVDLVGLLRIAKKQPKFSFRDTAVQSEINPLFAGVDGAEAETAEQIDESVVIRLGVENAADLAGGFPKLAEELFPFSAVVLDDLDADFFTQDQLLLLRQFVSSRGGALLILGGEESLERGGYSDTPLGELAPVYLGGTRVGALSQSRDEQSNNAGPYRMEITREGMLQPYLRLRVTEEQELQRLQSLPPFQVLNEALRVKPGAATLLQAVNSTGERFPAFATQPFGRGKTASLMFGDLWRWSMRRQEVKEITASEQFDSTNDIDDGILASDPGQAWRQLVRWLVGDVRRQLEAEIVPGQLAGTVTLVAQVQTAAFSPDDTATVMVKVTAPDGKTMEVPAALDNRLAGVYRCDYWLRDSGGYRFDVAAMAEDGTEIGTSQAGWVHDPVGAEFERLGINTQRLEEIAQRTGGKLVKASELNSLNTLLENQQGVIKEPWVYPIWHKGWVFLLAISCLCCEWGMRRWRGFP